MEGSSTEALRSRLGWYAAWLVAAPFAVFGTWYATQVGLGYDSHAYWSAVQDMDTLYDAPALSRDAYLYSPLFAQAIWPLGRLPWPAFGVLWSLCRQVSSSGCCVRFRPAGSLRRSSQPCPRS